MKLEYMAVCGTIWGDMQVIGELAEHEHEAFYEWANKQAEKIHNENRWETLPKLYVKDFRGNNGYP